MKELSALVLHGASDRWSCVVHVVELAHLSHNSVAVSIFTRSSQCWFPTAEYSALRLDMKNREGEESVEEARE